MAISRYGYTWLRPAGVAKTMMGRREEELEREEVERQLREAEELEELGRREQEEMLLQQQQQQQQQAGEMGEEAERDLDDDVPDADAQHGDEDIDGIDGDLDDEIPDADVDEDGDRTFGDTTADLAEGETGITDEVEQTGLGQDAFTTHYAAIAATRRVTTSAAAATARPAPGTQFEEFGPDEEEAIANAMLEEDEQAMAEQLAERDLDDDVPDAADADAEEWEHTDTDEEIEDDDEDEAGMDISNLEHSGIDRVAAARRSRVQQRLTPGNSSAMLMMESQAPDTAGSLGSTGSRRWFSGGARRNLFGRATGTGALFGFTPPQQVQQQQQAEEPPTPPRRRSRTRGFGRENRGRARDSLD